MRKFWALLAAIVVLAAGCTKDIAETGTIGVDRLRVLISECEGRVQLEDGIKPVWTEGDAVSIFNRSTANECWMFVGKTGATDGVLARGETLTGAPTDYIVGIYPYDSDHELDDDLLWVTIPDTQTYSKDSYGVGDNVMIAYGATENLTFRNLFGWLKLQLTGEGFVRKIVFEGNGDEPLTGLSLVDPLSLDYALDDDAGKVLTLDCGDGVELSDATTSFFIGLLPQTFSNGFKVTISFKDGSTLTKTTEKSIDVRRNHIVPMAAHKLGERSDREALIALYKATDGDNWATNTNWCSDAPLNEWYGVSMSRGRVSQLNLLGNKLVGTLPVELGNLTELQYLNLGSNSISGTIPQECGNLTKLVMLGLYSNQLSGDIPTSLHKIPAWKYTWGYTTYYNRFNKTKLYACDITAPDISVKDLDGAQLTLNATEYAKHKYTALFQWRSDSDPDFMQQMVKLYARYRAYGFEVVGWSDSALADMQTTIAKYGVEWRNFQVSNSNALSQYNSKYYPVGLFPCINVFDEQGRLVFSDCVESRGNLSSQLKTWLGEGDVEEKYASTDYSADGDVKTLQRASKGNGIDVILMGDGFSDRQIANGTYDAVMNKAVNALFSMEPYTTFRSLFNVYSVKVVSKHEGYDEGNDTALDGYFGEYTEVGGDDNTCFDYAEYAVASNRINESLIIVMMNREYYAGTCYMYYPSTGDYGSGPSIAYFPLGTDDEMFAELLLHEAGGHGFAKLDDEYAYEEYGRIPDEEISDRATLEAYGWWKNTDTESSRKRVKWAKFLSDTRYAYDGLGVYEGASTYWTGVYRPTYNSIMNDNTDGFNAPSREAIYYRIHKLAYGSSWSYDYETFVTYDAVNRKTSASAVATTPKRRHDFVPLARPRVVRRSWQDAR